MGVLDGDGGLCKTNSKINIKVHEVTDCSDCSMLQDTSLWPLATGIARLLLGLVD